MTTDTIKVKQQTTLTIVTPDFMAAHPELHHYTNFDGLRGIYERQHAPGHALPGPERFYRGPLLKQPLADALNARFTEIVRERQRDSFRIRRPVQETGGLQKVARSLADDLVASMYRVTFDPASDWACEPYIASFCTPCGCNSGLRARQRASKSVARLRRQRRLLHCAGYACTERDARCGVRCLLLCAYEHRTCELCRARCNGGPSVSRLDGALRTIRFAPYRTIPVSRPLAMTASCRSSSVPRCTSIRVFAKKCEVRVAAMPGTDKMLKQAQAEHPEIGAPPVKPNENAERRGRSAVTFHCLIRPSNVSRSNASLWGRRLIRARTLNVPGCLSVAT